MMFRGEGAQCKNWTDLQKLEEDLRLFDGLAENYTTITKLAIICFRKGLKMVIENPANKPHFLTSYWSLKPKIIDTDRRMNGDYMKKPTQYWFIGFEPFNNLVFEALDWVEIRNHERMAKGSKDIKTMRSEIHPQYANRFIRQYLIDERRKET